MRGCVWAGVYNTDIMEVAVQPYSRISPDKFEDHVSAWLQKRLRSVISSS